MEGDDGRIPAQSNGETNGEATGEGRDDHSASGWTTTKQAAKVLGVSRRSVQGYVRRGLLEAKEEGEGVNKTFLVSIDSLNALRDRRSREADEAAKFAEASAGAEQATNPYANTGEALRHAIDRVEARTAEATELRLRLEITEKAESTLREELDNERRRREEAERERDDLRRELDEWRQLDESAETTAREIHDRLAAKRGREETPSEPAGAPESAADEQQGRGPVPGTGGPSEAEGTQRRGFWARLFGTPGE